MPPQETLLTTPQVEFIENRLDGTFHPAFGQQGRKYDRAHRKFVLKPDSVGCPPEDSKLLSLHAIYSTAANAKQNFLTKVLGVTAAQEDLVTVNSWKDILDLIDEAVTKYDKSGKVRKGMRKLSDNAPAIQAWMGLFPSTSYSSTLCSGIKMVLDVAAGISKLREQVLGMLSEIPEYLAKTDLYVRLHEDVDSERIHKQSSRLYVALLEAVELMLEWLGRKPERKVLKAFSKGGADYGKEIQDKLADIEKIAGCVAEEAVICSQQKTNQVHAGINNQTELIKAMSANFGLKLNDIDSRGQVALDVVNAIYKYLNEPKNTPTEDKPIRLVASRKTFSQEVLRFLEFSPEPVFGELRTCFREGQASSVAAKDRVNMVLRSPEFVEWLAKATSSTLLINGNSDSAFISPMSHLCAFLGEALNSDKRRIPNSVYFCGLRGRDRSCSASDLVKSLIGQLMLRFEFDFSFLQGKKAKELNKPKQLCRLLRKLLQKLPVDTVLFWIIDGVSWFEGEMRMEETRTVFRKLIQMTKDCEDVVVKLLITSPGRSREVELMCKEEVVLNVPAFVDGEKQGTFAMRFEDAVGIVGKPEQM